MKLLTISPIILLHLDVGGRLVNHTIDDTLGDELTRFKVRYSPQGQPSNASALVWKNAPQCNDCAIAPQSSSAMNGTWTGATYDVPLGNVTAELAFHGSAIYIYFIVSNYPRSTGLVSDVICNFRMDGEVVGSYFHPTDETYHFEYNVLAYSNASLDDAPHTFLIETTGMQQSYVIFDYALYTDSEALDTGPTTPSLGLIASTTSAYVPSSSPPLPSSPGRTSTNSVKAMAAGVAVGLSALLIAAVALILLRRQRRQRGVNQPGSKEIQTQSHCCLPFLTRTARPDINIGLRDEQCLSPAQNLQSVRQKSCRESTVTSTADNVERRISVLQNRDLVVDDSYHNGRTGGSQYSANSGNIPISQWFLKDE